MEDIVIKGKSIGREIILLGILFILAECINLGTIIHYGRPASELLSQIGYVIILTLLLYCVILFVRIIVKVIVKVFKNK